MRRPIGLVCDGHFYNSADDCLQLAIPRTAHVVPRLRFPGDIAFSDIKVLESVEVVRQPSCHVSTMSGVSCSCTHRMMGIRDHLLTKPQVIEILYRCEFSRIRVLDAMQSGEGLDLSFQSVNVCILEADKLCRLTEHVVM